MEYTPRINDNALAARAAAAGSMVLLKNENASIRLDFVSYEFPETEYGMDEYDKNWLQLRCTWVDEDGYTHKDLSLIHI